MQSYFKLISKRFQLIVLIIPFLLTACEKEKNKFGHFTLIFDHKVNGNEVIWNDMCYVNEAGNPYELTEIMYFVSRVRLHSKDGDVFDLNPGLPFHYINPEIPYSLNWENEADIPVGIYDSITFTFGLASNDNISNRFVNPPESNMAWPEALGGGYHYMMMNGFYLDSLGSRCTNNFHLGKGQIYNDVHEVVGFIDNSFGVTPIGETFEIRENNLTTATITMNIESWFKTPVTYDFNVFGGAIMQKQAAMEAACKNGKDAFSVKFTY
ncbi:MAG TPA: MbnP family protein [Lentimicrobium sp.]|nr:MbnP family protein [Lentimicrobium sp.]